MSKENDTKRLIDIYKISIFSFFFRKMDKREFFEVSFSAKKVNIRRHHDKNTFYF